MDDAEPNAVAIYRSRSRQRCAEHALVLTAVGIDSAVHRLDGDFVVIVAPPDAARARRQLRLYIDENRWTGTAPVARGPVADGAIAATLYGMTILAVDMVAREAPAWSAAGRANAGLIGDGEWWRATTALTLHVDPVHLLGNLVFGALFAFLAGRLLGWGLAVASVLLAGTLGNLANAAIQPALHTSVGASTAVFACLGILAIFAWRRSRRLVNRWLPIGSGIALLALIGMGGGRTDIFAHLAGFASGAALGAGYLHLGWWMAPVLRRQLALGLAALALLAAAWFLALSGAG